MRISVWNAYRSSVLPQRWQDRLVENLISTAREKELLPMINAILQDLQNVCDRIGYFGVDPSESTGLVTVLLE